MSTWHKYQQVIFPDQSPLASFLYTPNFGQPKEAVTFHNGLYVEWVNFY